MESLTADQECAWRDKVVTLYRQAKAAHQLAVEEERRLKEYIVDRYGTPISDEQTGRE